MIGCRGNSQAISSEQGQTVLAVAIFVSLLLLVILGVATDYAQVWAHRQMAQAAADAACEAGAADLFLNATDPSASGINGLQSFSWIGNPYNCGTNASSPPCRYAALNGYSGSNVSVTFPSSLPGVAPLTGAFAVTNPYIQVTVTDPVTMSFSKLASSTSTVNIKATAGCGVAPISTPIPLVILHKSSSAALSVGGGSAKITIFGGAQRSIQVDSSDSLAASITGTIDLHQGGPANTGSDFGVFGGPSSKPGGINVGTTGHYLYPAPSIGDPFITLNPPSVPSTTGTATPVPFAVRGCPDPAGCVEFTGGNYASCSMSTSLLPGDNGCLVLPYSGGSTPKFSFAAVNWQPNNSYGVGTLILPRTPTCSGSSNPGNFIFQVTVAGTSASSCPSSWNQTYGGTTVGASGVTYKNVGIATTKPGTAIFDPGLYYVGAHGLDLGSNSTVRMSTAAGDRTLGVTFYFSSAASIAVTSNTGKFAACTSVTPSTGSGSPNSCIVSYSRDGTASPPATGSILSLALRCPSGSANPSQVPSTLDGNVLLGPCSGDYASPDGNRGFLFFQSRATSANPSWGGGGQFLSSGFMYFHSGNGATCGTSTTCLTLQGGSGSQSYTLGNIVVDKLSLGGNPQINMILNPTATFQVLKPTVLE